jgi:hypothetical protein
MQQQYASVALLQFLFGIFCAYWAQTTARNAWLWFFLGWFFAPITGIVLLAMNSRDKAKGESPADS